MILFAGYMVIGFRWTFLFFSSGYDLRITPVLLLGVLLTAVAQIMIAADRLLHGKRRPSCEATPTKV